MSSMEWGRYMRLVCFFDLPVETAKQRKDYRQFRKNLIKEGFLMMQESVYVKLVVTDAAADAAIARMKKYRPTRGLVQVLKVTERQFETMTYVTGERGEFVEVDTPEELLIL